MENGANRAWLDLPDNTQHELTGVCTLGRKPSNTIVLADGTVSGSHAVIQPEGARHWTLTDLRSTNGTYVRERRISAPVQLRHQVPIRIGPFTLTFHQPGAEEPEGTRGLVPAGTIVQTYSGPCWLLLLDLENFTARRQALGEARSAALMRAWTLATRSVVEANGGTLNSQPGDALLFYWRDNGTTGVRAMVDTTLRALLSVQQQHGELPFRIVLHQGTAQLTFGELRIEQIAGPEVDFLFRIEKLAKPLRTRCLLSEVATLQLELSAEARPLGAHGVPSFVGQFHLYGLGPEPLTAPASSSAPPLPPPVVQNILLVAPGGAMADGLSQLLAGEADLAIAGHATSARDARQLRESKRPQLAVVDLSHDDADVLTLIRDFTMAAPPTPVLAIADAADGPRVERAIRSGAAGAVLRNDPTNELLLGIRTALAGNVYLSRRIAATALRALAGSDAGGRRGGPAELSDRQLEIFHLVASGRPNRAIADALGVSVKTVETHKENIKVKLEVTSTAELTALARKWLDDSRSRPPF